MATDIQTTEARLRRKTEQVRFSHSHPERRKRTATGFDVAAALELNLDRYPLKQDQLMLLQRWLLGAELEGLATRRPDYPVAIRRGIMAMSESAKPEDAIVLLQQHA